MKIEKHDKQSNAPNYNETFNFSSQNAISGTGSSIALIQEMAARGNLYNAQNWHKNQSTNGLADFMNQYRFPHYPPVSPFMMPVLPHGFQQQDLAQAPGDISTATSAVSIQGPFPKAGHFDRVCIACGLNCASFEELHAHIMNKHLMQTVNSNTPQHAESNSNSAKTGDKISNENTNNLNNSSTASLVRDKDCYEKFAAASKAATRPFLSYSSPNCSSPSSGVNRMSVHSSSDHEMNQHQQLAQQIKGLSMPSMYPYEMINPYLGMTYQNVMQQNGMHSIAALPMLPQSYNHLSNAAGFNPYLSYPFTHPANLLPPNLISFLSEASAKSNYTTTTNLNANLHKDVNSVQPDSNKPHEDKHKLSNDNTSGSNQQRTVRPESNPALISSSPAAVSHIDAGHMDALKRRVSMPVVGFNKDIPMSYNYKLLDGTRSDNFVNNSIAERNKNDAPTGYRRYTERRKSLSEKQKQLQTDAHRKSSLNAKNVEQHISKLISDNEKVLLNPDLERVKPRRVLRRSSLDPASLSSYATSLNPACSDGHTDSSDCDKPIEKHYKVDRESEVAKRANLMSTASKITANYPHDFSQAEYNKVIAVANMLAVDGKANSPHGMDGLVKHAVDISKTFMHYDQNKTASCNSSVRMNDAASQFLPTKKLKRATFFECCDCGVRYRKEENYAIHKQVYCKYKKSSNPVATTTATTAFPNAVSDSDSVFLSSSMSSPQNDNNYFKPHSDVLSSSVITTKSFPASLFDSQYRNSNSNSAAHRSHLFANPMLSISHHQELQRCRSSEAKLQNCFKNNGLELSPKAPHPERSGNEFRMAKHGSVAASADQSWRNGSINASGRCDSNKLVNDKEREHILNSNHHLVQDVTCEKVSLIPTSMLPPNKRHVTSMKQPADVVTTSSMSHLQSLPLLQPGTQPDMVNKRLLSERYGAFPDSLNQPLAADRMNHLFPANMTDPSGLNLPGNAINAESAGSEMFGISEASVPRSNYKVLLHQISLRNMQDMSFMKHRHSVSSLESPWLQRNSNTSMSDKIEKLRRNSVDMWTLKQSLHLHKTPVMQLNSSPGALSSSKNSTASPWGQNNYPFSRRRSESECAGIKANPVSLKRPYQLISTSGSLALPTSPANFSSESVNAFTDETVEQNDWKVTVSPAKRMSFSELPPADSIADPCVKAIDDKSEIAASRPTTGNVGEVEAAENTEQSKAEPVVTRVDGSAVVENSKVSTLAFWNSTSQDCKGDANKTVGLYSHLQPTLLPRPQSTFCCLVNPQPAHVECCHGTSPSAKSATDSSPTGVESSGKFPKSSGRKQLSMYSQWEVSEPILPADLTVNHLLQCWRLTRHDVNHRAGVTVTSPGHDAATKSSSRETVVTDSKSYKTAAKSADGSDDGDKRSASDEATATTASLDDDDVTHHRRRVAPCRYLDSPSSYVHCHQLSPARHPTTCAFASSLHRPPASPACAAHLAPPSGLPRLTTPDVHHPTMSVDAKSRSEDGDSDVSDGRTGARGRADRLSDCCASASSGGEGAAQPVVRVKKRKTRRQRRSAKLKRESDGNRSSDPSSTSAAVHSSECGGGGGASVGDKTDPCALCTIKAASSSCSDVVARSDDVIAADVAAVTCKDAANHDAAPVYRSPPGYLDKTKASTGSSTQHWVSKLTSSAAASAADDVSIHASAPTTSQQPSTGAAHLAEVVSEVMRSAERQTKLRPPPPGGDRADEQRAASGCDNRQQVVTSSSVVTSHSFGAEQLHASAAGGGCAIIMQQQQRQRGGDANNNLTASCDVAAVSTAADHQAAASCCSDDAAASDKESGSACVRSRQYKCADCNVAFRISGHLAKHIRSKGHLLKVNMLRMKAAATRTGSAGSCNGGQLTDYHHISTPAFNRLHIAEMITSATGSNAAHAKLECVQPTVGARGDHVTDAASQPIGGVLRVGGDCHVTDTELVECADEVISSHDPRPFKCLACKVAFRFQGHLDRHFRSNLHLIAVGHYEQDSLMIASRSSSTSTSSLHHSSSHFHPTNGTMTSSSEATCNKQQAYGGGELLTNMNGDGGYKLVTHSVASMLPYSQTPLYRQHVVATSLSTDDVATYVSTPGDDNVDVYGATKQATPSTNNNNGGGESLSMASFPRPAVSCT